jgi:SAM-dependent methyltransferase
MSRPSRPCPLLERASASEPLRDAPGPWDLRRCEETGFVYLANPPAQERFREEFAWEVTHAQESARRRQDEPAVYAVSQAVKKLRHRLLKRDKVVSLVRQIAVGVDAGPIRLVDIGCAEGRLFLRLIDRLPRRVATRVEPIGIEISTHLAGVASEVLRPHGGTCVHSTGIDGLATLPKGSIHVVVLSCILEHEIEPLPLLRACRERLAPGGRIVVKVPNHACLARRIRGPRWCGYRWPDHVNYFTPGTLAAMASRAGLSVVRMNAADRSPFSDSLYAVFGRDEAAGITAARRAA